ncbi:MAG: response regulator [Clostridiales bacterium]|nr:response regulator [Clostridiales bacterium]
MGPVRVIVIEMNETHRKQLVEELTQYGGIQVVGETGNGLEGLQMIMDPISDVVICNMILPYYDGFAILEKMSMLPAQTRPKFIAYTSLTREGAIKRAISMGIDEYMIKPVDSGMLVKRIFELAGRMDLLVKQPETSAEHHSYAREDELSPYQKVPQAISTLFLRIGIPAHVLGYRFACEAIRLVVDNPKLMTGRTKVLYPLVAQTYETTPFCVERAIRHLITITWDRKYAETFERVQGKNARLHLPAEKPTSGEFIALIAEYIRQRCQLQAFHRGE